MDMFIYLPRLSQMLFAPSTATAADYLAHAVDLEDLERREALLEDELRRNLQPTH